MHAEYDHLSPSYHLQAHAHRYLLHLPFLYRMLFITPKAICEVHQQKMY